MSFLHLHLASGEFHFAASLLGHENAQSHDPPVQSSAVLEAQAAPQEYEVPEGVGAGEGDGAGLGPGLGEGEGEDPEVL